jgi:NAD(P)-dependent dehydrogenase (short-subunit alcohol dehydrogenase family)
VAEVEEKLGPVDLLVNNAGHGGRIAPSWEVEPDEWWQCVGVNFLGPFLCARAVLPRMIARRRGRIVNTASAVGLRHFPNHSAYTVSKAAVIRLSEALAAEVKEHGISVFAIHPGEVETVMTKTQFWTEGCRKWYPEFYNRLTKGEVFKPAEPAGQLVVYLASGRADALSGCFISVHADVAEMASRAPEIQEVELYRLRLRT